MTTPSGRLTGRRGRPRSPRRHILDQLRDVNRGMRSLVSLWDVTGTNWDTDLCASRPRRPDEYPENDPGLLDATADRLDRLASTLTELARYARAEAASRRLAQRGT